MVRLEVVNKMKVDEFTDTFQDIFEHSSWIPRRVWDFRPFDSIVSLHQKMVEVVDVASRQEKLLLIQAHPHLGTRKTMSSSSLHEQKKAGLNQLSDEEYEAFMELNKDYVQKFGFPFILAVRGKGKDEIVTAMKERLNHTQEDEFNQALTEIYRIALFRLEEKLS